MSSDVLSFKVHMSDDFASKVASLLQDDEETMLEIHNLFAQTVDPWVPFLEGPLSQTIEVTPEYVKYTQPYSHYQYYGDNFNHTTDYHPLASARWDQVAMQTKLEEFTLKVQEILQRRAKSELEL